MLRKIVNRFRRNEGGSVAIMAALAAVPMLVVMGVAVDYVHASGIKSRLQSSLDAAALAAASSRSLSDKARIKLANDVFAQNWSDPLTRDIAVSPKFQIKNDRISADASFEIPSSFMQLAGIKSIDIDAETEINVPQQKNAEVVLVLDFSESMTEKSGGKVKYVAMKEAATKLIDDLSKSGKDKVKIGLVPFSHQVEVTLPKTMVAGQSGSGNWIGCTQDRLYPYNISDSTPDKNDDATKWNQDVLTYHGGCAGYALHKLALQPLTADFDSLTGKLADMTPYAYTHIALGVEFGWHVLSPNAPFGGGASYGDKDTQKFMVVLTDGAQTEPAYGPKGSRNVSNGEENLETLCQNIKDKGVTLITVAFDLDDSDTRKRLKTCSSSADTDFFVAESADDVAQAFNTIKTAITSQVFVSR